MIPAASVTIILRDGEIGLSKVLDEVKTPLRWVVPSERVVPFLRSATNRFIMVEHSTTTRSPDPA